MAATFIPAVDLVNSTAERRGLSSEALSYLGAAWYAVAPATVQTALEHLGTTFGLYQSFLDVSAVTSIDSVVALLDAGAFRVFVSEQQRRELEAVENLDRERFVLKQLDSSVAAVESACASTADAVYLHDVAEVDALEAAIKKRPVSHDGPQPLIYVSIRSPSPEIFARLAQTPLIPVVPAALLTVDPTASPDLINAAALLLSKTVSDRPDGLFTTLVVDERDTALGLVYSSQESVSESLRTGQGVYQSRKRGLWYKGATSGDTQQLVSIGFDCDSDCVRFVVRQKGRGFCHLATATCFGEYRGLSKLQKTLQSRMSSAPAGSYTARLFNDPNLLNAKIKEEADELCEASDKDHIAFEAADLFYFALTKCVAAGVTLEDVERKLDSKSLTVKRRKGDAKAAYISTNGVNGTASKETETVKEAASVPKAKEDPAGLDDGRIHMARYVTSEVPPETITEALKRPSQRSMDMIMGIIKPIIEDVRTGGDAALLKYTHKFEKATALTTPVLLAPFPEHLMQLSQETVDAINISYDNIRRFHAAQEDSPIQVETMPGVVCSRFARPIERVGLYVPGGTAVLPSSALMLGVPAMVAGCKTIVLATPPRADGSISPEIVYIAHKVGAKSIVLAGGAQAIAALAYGTESSPKVDKILGPGNQFVTAAKMHVSNDTTASVSIDMPAGPSEVLVVADATSNPHFVASDLLSQAEHGVDSQVVLIAVGMAEAQLRAVEDALHAQASALPRVDIVRGAIAHSVTLVAADIAEAMRLSNAYAPEHLIIQTADPDAAAALVEHAGSVFVGPWTPESVGDYSAGVNHSLPTYGYARQYSGVNLGSYVKHITSSKLTEQGLRNVGGAVQQLAKVEGLEAHRRAVSIRLAQMDGKDWTAGL